MGASLAQAHLTGVFVFQQVTQGVLDDVIHNEGGGVKYPAGFLHLGLVFDHGMVSAGETDDLAQELLVDLPEDIGGQHRELVGAFGVIQVGENILERFIIQRQTHGEGVGRISLTFLCPEVEQTGVIAIIGIAEQLAQARVDVTTVEQSLQLTIELDATVFTDAQEDQAVDGHLDGIIQVTLAEGRVAQGDIMRQQVAPALDLRQEGVIHFSGAMLAGGTLGVLVERAFEHRLTGENRRRSHPNGWDNRDR